MFELDMFMLNYFKKLVSDSYTQFMTSLAVLFLVSAIFPERKKK